MGKGRRLLDMRSCSMDGRYNRINPSKDMYSISELHASEVPSSSVGYARLGKPSSIFRRLRSFPWSMRRSSKQTRFDDTTDGLDDSATPPPSKATTSEAETPYAQAMKKTTKKKFGGIKNFLNGILDSYRKIMQSAEEVDMQLSDLYPGNPMVAPVTPAASTRSIKYISPSSGVGRNSLVRVAEESSRER